MQLLLDVLKRMWEIWEVHQLRLCSGAVTLHDLLRFQCIIRAFIDSLSPFSHQVCGNSLCTMCKCIALKSRERFSRLTNGLALRTSEEGSRFIFFSWDLSDPKNNVLLKCTETTQYIKMWLVLHVQQMVQNNSIWFLHAFRLVWFVMAGRWKVIKWKSLGWPLKYSQGLYHHLTGSHVKRSLEVMAVKDTALSVSRGCLISKSYSKFPNRHLMQDYFHYSNSKYAHDNK